MDNKLGEAIHKASQSHNAECREEAQAEKQEYIDRVDSSVRTIIREEVKTQLPQILPKAVLDFATPSTYEAAASLLEYELMKILLDKIEESKSHLRADYRRKIYDALVESYNTDKDLFNTYGEVFTLKRSRDDKDKDQDISAGSDRGMKRRKSSKEAESPKDQRLKEGKSSSSSKGTSRSHHKSSGKSAHAEEPSHIVDDSGVQKNQEFDTSNNDEQPDDEAASKNDWFKKPERPPTPDPDWNKRQQNFWLDWHLTFSKEPARVTELEYHFEECSKAITERLDWHNPKGKPESMKDVYSRKRIIAFTRLKIMKWNKDRIPAKEEMEWIRQTTGLCYDLGYREVALSKEVNVESREVYWWKRIRE
ncbi:hypothetical protein Tco_0381430 [Tanacetum coccineum]